MIYRALFEKISRGEPLDSQEHRQWMQLADKLPYLDLLSNFTQLGTSTPKMENGIFSNPTWLTSPLHACFAHRSTDTTVSHATNTYVTFETTRNFGSLWSVNGDRVIWSGVGEKAFQVEGYVIWVANGTGYRGAWLEGFDEDDVSIGTTPLHTFAGFTGIDNVMPISFSFYFNGFSYVKFYVYQSSGGNLVMKDFLISVSLI